MNNTLFPQGKRKALVLSYDDGLSQDRRMIDCLDQHGIKGTFNLNSGKLGQKAEWLQEITGQAGQYISAKQLPSIYAKHEVAAHSVNHPYLNSLDAAQLRQELQPDRRQLQQLSGQAVEAFAYPFGQYNQQVITALGQAGFIAARGIEDTPFPHLPSDLLCWQPSSHHRYALAQLQQFVDADVSEPTVFVLWGHSWEFDLNHSDNSWAHLQDLCALAGGRDDIWYAGMGEVARHLLAQSDF